MVKKIIVKFSIPRYVIVKDIVKPWFPFIHLWITFVQMSRYYQGKYLYRKKGCVLTL